MRKNLLILVLSSCVILLDAQSIIKGKVTDAENNPIDYFNVLVCNVVDTSIVTGATCYKSDFSISNIHLGRYLLKISSVGYVDYFQSININNDSTMTLSIIRLKTNELGEVVVTARRPTIISKSDRIIVNVEGSALAETKNGTEMLKHTPGINFDGRETFTVPGRDNAIFYIDNIKINSMDEIASLDPNTVKSIEIIDNPSVMYEADGQAVVLIKTKKRKDTSVQFETGITQSRKTAGWGNIEAVFGMKKMTTDLYYNYSTGNSWGNEKNTRTLPDFQVLSEGLSNSEYNIHNLKLKFDFEINKKQSIALQINGRYSISDGNRNDTVGFTNTDYTNFYTISDSWYRSKQINSTLNYTYDIDTLGQKLLVACDVNYQNINNGSNYYNKKENDTTSAKFINTTSNYKHPFLFSVKADYSKPISKLFTLDLGLKFYSIKSDTKSDLTGSTNLNQHYITKEENIAGYVNSNFKLNEKFSFNIGVRIENMYRQAIKEGNAYLDTVQFGIYPSVQLNYNFSENQQLGLSYSKKISRPSFSMLDPSIFRDSLFTRSGNPDLKSTDIHTFQMSLGVVKNLQLRLSYIYYVNPFYFITYSDYNNPIINKVEFINLDKNYRWIGTLIYNKSIMKEWSIGIVGTGYTNSFKYNDVDGIQKKNNSPGYNIDISSSVTLPYKILFDCGVKHQSNGSWGAIYNYSTSNVFFSLQRNFFDNTLNVILSTNDIFNSSISQQQSVLFGNNLNYYNGDNRYIELSIKYKIGKTTFKKKIQSGSDEEKNRL